MEVVGPEIVKAGIIDRRRKDCLDTLYDGGVFPVIECRSLDAGEDRTSEILDLNLSYVSHCQTSEQVQPISYTLS